jgi:ABC-type dipeptide/oligopeptide/nickel transport system ATPase component
VEPLLALRGLTVTFPSEDGETAVVDGADLTVGPGELVGLVGVSGSGKSMTALAVLRLVPPPGRIAGGSIRFAGQELLALSERAMRRVRGGAIGVVFQEPASALNPVFSIGFQIGEVLRLHRGLASRRAVRDEAVSLLDKVGLPAARRRLDDYPHQLSGGQRQRVMLAIALAAGPRLLLADEPTTALDVTLQAQVLSLLAALAQELGMAVLLITHDLAVVAETCRRAAVMLQGRIVEQAAVDDLFRRPSHPYTRTLVAAAVG